VVQKFLFENILNTSIDAAKNFVEIFGEMKRLDELKKYYYQCEKLKILEVNKQLLAEVIAVFDKHSGADQAPVSFGLETPAGQNPMGDSLKSLLKSWYDHAIKTWHDETQWCRQIFNDSHEIVLNLLTKCFEEFDVSFQKLLDKFAAQPKNDEYFLNYLDAFRVETDRFALIINSSADNLSLLKVSQVSDALFKLFKEVYSPYKAYSVRYTSLVSKYLQYQLETNIKMVTYFGHLQSRDLDSFIQRCVICLNSLTIT
jgi:hypothetical protein